VTDISDSLSFFILGSDGQVGMALCQYLSERQIPHLSLSTQELQAPNVLKERLASVSCRYVVNTVCEEPSEGVEPDWGRWAAIASDVAVSCEEQEKVLFHISSAKVFSGESPRAYVETDEPGPKSDLGKAYWEIEQQTAKQCEMSIILRVSWLFSEQVDNFLTRLVGAAIRQESLQVSGKLRGCPTDAHVVARVIVAIAEQVDCGTSEPPLWGTYHYADSDACSMHTFAKTVITVVKSMAEVRVETIEEGETQTMVDTIAEQENYELSCKKILSTFGIKQRPWRRGVHEVLKHKFSSN